ncbi:MAG: dual specificity protein phosphatase family protein [Candidatus Tectomicrobia bacterium]|uniref:Dual specificity protein phosphatase family protein n=1 Tax=Tectimicrobiota bacterium TaxID=2528274 RepID=A0A932GQE4_UNCTE|nr:dual specificity protein phosphatase family protein [Candidatus Tectomicrobia bacterium]
MNRSFSVAVTPARKIWKHFARKDSRCWVSLLREQEQPPRYDVDRVLALGYARRNIPVRDFQPPSLAQLGEFVDFVSHLRAGSKIVIHCEAGVGRTGTFAAAYWIGKGLPAA